MSYITYAFLINPAPLLTSIPERIPKTATLYADAFRTDPVITYMLCNLTPERKNAWLYSYFTRLLTAAGLNGATFDEAQDFTSVQVIIPPGKKADNLWTLIPAGIIGALWMVGFQGCKRMMSEFTGLSEKAKKKGLKGENKYFYIFFIATREDQRGKGLSSALIRKCQERARNKGLPVWLEATTEKSQRLYSKLGFELVERMVLGKGVAGPDGARLKGGEGVPIWAMVWWPDEPEKPDS